MAYKKDNNKVRDENDLGEWLDQTAYPALYDRLDQAFPEFGWKTCSGGWVATKWPEGFPSDAEDKRADRLNCYADRRHYVKVHGRDGVRWLEYLSGQTKLRGAEFVETCRKIADLAGVTFPERERTPEEIEADQQRQLRRALLEHLIAIGAEALWAPGGKACLEYVRSRGLSDETIRDFRLGILADDVETYVRRLAGSEYGWDADSVRGFLPAWSGIFGYVVVPWKDELGRPLTLYGRWPGEPPEGRPKTYALPGANSKCVPLCFDRARRAGGGAEVVIVEGLFDVLVAQAAGDARVIGTIGGCLSNKQIETLQKCGVKRAFICGDPDGGGDAGTVSNVLRLANAGVTPYVVERLPEGLDPDQFILGNGIDAWRGRVEKAGHGFRHVAAGILAAHSTDGRLDDVQAERVIAAAKDAARKSTRARPEELRRYLFAPIAERVDCHADDLMDAFGGGGGGAEKMASADSPAGDKDGDAGVGGNATPDPAGEGTPASDAARPLVNFPDPIPASKLPRIEYADLAILDGYLYRGRTSLLWSLPKVGKTTLLGHLIRAMTPKGARETQESAGDTFLGRALRRGKILYVSEENAGDWGNRVARLAIGDHLDVLARPIPAVDVHPRVIWMSLVDHLARLVQRNKYDLLVIDTLGYSWGVEDENSAPQVQAALNHLTGKFPDAALLLNHHSRKSGGEEGTGARGSVALMGYVDVGIELRRTAPQDPTDRRRTLITNSRIPDAPAELVFELTPEGDLIEHGDRASSEVARFVAAVPTSANNAVTADDLAKKLGVTKKSQILNVLRSPAACQLGVVTTGEGKKGDPYRFHRVS